MRAFAITRKDISHIERDVADNSKQTAKERDLAAISRQVTRIRKQTTNTGLLFNVLYRLFLIAFFVDSGNDYSCLILVIRVPPVGYLSSAGRVVDGGKEGGWAL